MDRGAWWAAVHGFEKSRTWLSKFTFTFHFHALEKEMATHSSILAWRIPGAEEPGGLLFLELHRVRHDWNNLAETAECRCLLLPSPVWPLPICLIHGPNIPGSYAILLFTASNLGSITSSIHNWVLFLLWLHPFILSGVISPLISSSILGTYWPGVDIFQSPIFSYCSWSSQGKNTEVVCHSLLQWSTFCQTSPSWPVHLGWPHKAWLNFIELDKTVVCVIRLASCLWLWFQSVCPLRPSLSTYHLTLVSLTLGVGYLFTVTPAKLLLLTLDVGHLLSVAPAQSQSPPLHPCSHNLSLMSTWPNSLILWSLLVIKS